MSKVVISLSMSLDGLITGPGDGPGAGLGKGGERLFDWYFSGTDPHPRYPMFRPQGPNRTAMERIFDSEKAVGVSGADVARQCLRAGLVDELWLAVGPTLLGDGVRLFEDLRPPLDLEVLEVLDGPRATHLRYRVRDGGR